MSSSYYDPYVYILVLIPSCQLLDPSMPASVIASGKRLDRSFARIPLFRTWSGTCETTSRRAGCSVLPVVSCIKSARKNTARRPCQWTSVIWRQDFEVITLQEAGRLHMWTICFIAVRNAEHVNDLFYWWFTIVTNRVICPKPGAGKLGILRPLLGLPQKLRGVAYLSWNSSTICNN